MEVQPDLHALSVRLRCVVPAFRLLDFISQCRNMYSSSFFVPSCLIPAYVIGGVSMSCEIPIDRQYGVCVRFVAACIAAAYTPVCDRNASLHLAAACMSVVAGESAVLDCCGLLVPGLCTSLSINSLHIPTTHTHSDTSFKTFNEELKKMVRFIYSHSSVYLFCLTSPLIA
jgi:hypothetical protein